MKRARRMASSARSRLAGRRLLVESLEARELMASDVIRGLGVIGDDYSDEYDPQAYTYASNWVELLADRGVNLGAKATYDDFRGTGYLFNWSLNQATSLDLVIEGSSGSLAGQVFDDQVTHAVLMAGMNDFGEVEGIFGGLVYERIYSGAYADFEVQFQIDNTAVLMASTIETLAGTWAHVVVATIPDPGDTPYYRGKYTSAAGRQRVTDAIQATNAQIRQAAAENHLPVLDLFAMQKALLGTHASPIASQTIGGRVYSSGTGNAANSTALFTADGIHPHTAMQAIIANGVVTAMNLTFGEDLPLISEQQINTLTGQTFVSNTLNFNYASFVTVPDVRVVLDFGTAGDAGNDFAARMNALASSLGIAAFTSNELTQIRANVMQQLSGAFDGTNVVFTDDIQTPLGGRYHRLHFGLTNEPTTQRNAVVGHFAHDWRNLARDGIGFIAADELGQVLPGIAGLNRASQLQYIRNALSFYSIQGIGLALGLSHADAFARPGITPANYANTGGVQNVDYMSGNPALGFNPTVFQTTTTFSFSPLARAKLRMAVGVYADRLAAAVESATAHGTAGTAQALTLDTVPGGVVRAKAVSRAQIATAGELDFYQFTVQSGQLVTVQTLRSDQEGMTPTNLDTVVELIGPNGTTVLATSDDTFLGNNSIGQAGTTFQTTNSLVVNFPAPSAGTYFVKVRGRDSTVGEYDLLVATAPQTAAANAWTNPSEPRNVDGEPGIVPLDALIVINELNNPQFSNSDGSLRPPPNGMPPPYYDVDADGYVTALDALIIINYLNNPSASGEGEAASSSGGSAGLLVDFAPIVEESTPAPAADRDEGPTYPATIHPVDEDWLWLVCGDKGEDKDGPASTGSAASQTTEVIDALLGENAS
jgi:lysophospholipase L1-like esterase